MALIDCPECGHHISDLVKECPRCGLSMKDVRRAEQKKLQADAPKSSLLRTIFLTPFRIRKPARPSKKKENVPERSVLVECRECNGAISRSAKACPHCGATKPWSPPRNHKPFLIACGIIAAFLVLINLSSDDDDKSNSGSSYYSAAPAPKIVAKTMGERLAQIDGVDWRDDTIVWPYEQLLDRVQELTGFSRQEIGNKTANIVTQIDEDYLGPGHYKALRHVYLLTAERVDDPRRNDDPAYVFSEMVGAYVVVTQTNLEESPGMSIQDAMNDAYYGVLGIVEGLKKL